MKLMKSVEDSILKNISLKKTKVILIDTKRITIFNGLSVQK